MCQDGVCVCAGSEIHFPNFTPRTVAEPQADRSETRLIWEPLSEGRPLDPVKLAKARGCTRNNDVG
jgi:hypothetical protein